MQNESSDEALMQQYAAGVMAAFDTLYHRHRSGLYGFIWQQCRDPGLCDEVFQDTWLRVTRSRADYQPTAAFRTWLYQIARNRLIDLLRLHKPDLLADSQGSGEEEAASADPYAAIASNDDGPEEALDRKQQAATLQAAIHALPAVQREAFLLREHGECTLEDIARLTGVNTETAKSRLRYAVNKLRAALRGRV